jgi:hypothetical protein
MDHPHDLASCGFQETYRSVRLAVRVASAEALQCE